MFFFCLLILKEREKMTDFFEKIKDTEFYKFFENIFDTFFNPELTKYENINLGSGGVVSLRFIIIGLMFGFCVAAFVSLYEKRMIGSFAKKLLKENCIDKENAKTLYELGYERSLAVRSSLKSGTTLKKWVKCVEEDEFYASIEEKRAEFEAKHPGEQYIYPAFKRDCDTMRFYIPSELKYKADVKFNTRGTNIVSVILVILVSIVMFSVLCSVIPDMLIFVDNFMSVIQKK